MKNCKESHHMTFSTFTYAKERWRRLSVRSRRKKIIVNTLLKQFPVSLLLWRHQNHLKRNFYKLKKILELIQKKDSQLNFHLLSNMLMIILEHHKIPKSGGLLLIRKPFYVNYTSHYTADVTHTSRSIEDVNNKQAFIITYNKWYNQEITTFFTNSPYIIGYIWFSRFRLKSQFR